MQKSVRSMVLVTALTLAAAPAMQAERAGCNPHPQAVAVPTTLQLTAAAILTYLGF